MKTIGIAFVIGVLAAASSVESTSAAAPGAKVAPATATTPAPPKPADPATATLVIRPSSGAAQCTTAPEVHVAIEVVANGAWIGASDGARCFVARRDGALDAAALDAELKTLRGAPGGSCTTSIEIAGATGTSYQDVITAMDHAIKVGFVDTGVLDPAALSVSFDDSAARQKHAPAHCVGSASAAAVSTSTRLASASPAGAAPTNPDLAKAPVIVITRTSVELAGKDVGTAAKLAAGKGPIDALVKALKALTPAEGAGAGILILQADASTSMALINRVIESGKAAGFANALFAVKNK